MIAITRMEVVIGIYSHRTAWRYSRAYEDLNNDILHFGRSDYA